MRRTISFILIICMLFSQTAMAAENSSKSESSNTSPFSKAGQFISNIADSASNGIKKAGDKLKSKFNQDDLDDAAKNAGSYPSNLQTTDKLADEYKFSNPNGGHGYAAERANDWADKLKGKDSKVVGDNNVKNGADREIIENGILTQIQSKYYSTGKACIDACFDDVTGQFRYWQTETQPMIIEVPSDKLSEAIEAMKKHILNGDVKGITDPDMASEIVKPGNITYEQAKNIAKAGNIDSIKYDASKGAVICLSAFGISATVSFALSVWNGDTYEKAFQTAVFNGLRVGGTAFLTSVLASQLSKAGMNSALVSSSEAIVTNTLGYHGAAFVANAFRSGTNIYGAAAMRSAAKILRGNVITASASMIILSSVDISDIVRGRISKKQLAKNLVNTASTVTGGTLGATYGMAAGSAIMPGIGSVIGSIAGGFIGATASGVATSKVTDHFWEDDAEAMLRIIEKEFNSLSDDYLLSQTEADEIIKMLNKKLTSSTTKDMYASTDKNQFARDLLLPLVEDVISQRQTIDDISAEQMQLKLIEIMEEIAIEAEKE